MKETHKVQIDGKPLPPIAKLQIDHEKIWSKNTGRTDSGEMVGDIVTRKWKLQIEFAPLSDAQVSKLEGLIDPAFFDVTFRSPRTGENTTVSMYAGTPSYPVYSYVNGLPRYLGVTVDLIEK